MNKYYVLVSLPDNKWARVSVLALACEVSGQYILTFYGDAKVKVAEFNQWLYWELADKAAAKVAT